METKSNRPTQESNTTLVIPYQVNEVLNYLAKENKLEWQCFAEVEELVGNKFRINNLVFPKQQNTSASTKTTEEEYAEAVEGMDESKGFCWIHSHNTMGTFWSTTDYEQMDRQRTTNGEHTFSLVVNTAGDRKAALNMHRPVTENFDMEVEVEPPAISKALLEAIELEMASEQEGVIDSISIGININDIEINEEFLKKYQEALDAVQRFYKPTQTKYPHSAYDDDSWAENWTKKWSNRKESNDRITATPDIVKKLKVEMKRIFDRHGYETEPDDIVELVEEYETKFDKNKDTFYAFVYNYIAKTYNI